MNIRVWTIEELGRVRPLDKGWHWEIRGIWPEAVGPHGERVSGAGGALRSHSFLGMPIAPPNSVALSVLLVSKELDATETLTEQAEREQMRRALERLAVAAGMSAERAAKLSALGSLGAVFNLWLDVRERDDTDESTTCAEAVVSAEGETKP